MYESFYGFSGDPFRLTPDRRFCYPHRTFSRARAYLEYGVQRAEGFVMVTGRPGTGKTTLLEDLLCGLDQSRLRVVRLNTTRLEGRELIRMIAYSLNLRADQMDKASLLRQIIRGLDQDHRAGRRAILMIDEAQGLPEDSLEELRFLTNLEKDGMPLIQILLVGQPPLRELVQAPVMEQLHQRLIAACHLEPLTVDEVRAYVEHRLRRVGWRGDPHLAPEIYPVIHRVSDGIPRRVNQVLSRLLMYGFVEEKRHFVMEDMRAVLTDLRDEMLLPPEMHDFERVFSDLPPPPPAPEPDPVEEAQDASTRREPQVDVLEEPAPADTPPSPTIGLRPARTAPATHRPSAPSPTVAPPTGKPQEPPARRGRLRLAIVAVVLMAMIAAGGAALLVSDRVDVSAIAGTALPGWLVAMAGAGDDASPVVDPPVEAARPRSGSRSP